MNYMDDEHLKTIKEVVFDALDFNGNPHERVMCYCREYGLSRKECTALARIYIKQYTPNLNPTGKMPDWAGPYEP